MEIFQSHARLFELFNLSFSVKNKKHKIIQSTYLHLILNSEKEIKRIVKWNEQKNLITIKTNSKIVKIPNEIYIKLELNKNKTEQNSKTKLN